MGSSMTASSIVRTNELYPTDSARRVPPGTPVRTDREPVTTHGGRPPFDGTAVQAPGAFNKQAGHRTGHGQQSPHALLRHHRGDPFTAAGQAHPAPAGELVIEPAAGEVGVEHRCGEVRGQPDPIVGQWFLIRPPQAFEIDELGVVGQY